MGCHDHKNVAPRENRPPTLALRAGPERLKPFYGPQRGFSFAAEIQPLPPEANLGQAAPGAPRWDGADLQAFTGTYGDYLLGKVAKVFPELGGEVL